MSSWTHLSDELSKCERQIIAIRLKNEEKVQKENERYAQVEKTREECIEAHKAKVDAAVEEYELQLRRAAKRAEGQVKDAQEAQRQARKRQLDFVRRTEVAERQALELEQELVELQKALEEALAEEELRSTQVLHRADIAVQQRLQDTNNCIFDTARYASEIQNGIVNSIEVMHKEHKANIRDTEAASTERSRFKELYDTAVSHAAGETQLDETVKQKSELTQGWFDDWVRATAERPRALWTDTLRLEGTAEDPLKPSDAASPRAVERARKRVEEQLHLAQGGRLPLTAP